MTKFNRITLVNTILLLFVIIVLLFNYKSTKLEDIVYVNNIKLFNGFNMTKDIKTIEESKINKQAKELDGLYLKMKSITDKTDNSFKSLQQQIAKKSKNLQELQDNYAQSLSQNVWERLNQYIEAYAKEKKLKIVLGGNGSGNVMFAQDNIDITAELLEFSNNKYEGN